MAKLRSMAWQYQQAINDMTFKAILHKEDGGYWAEVPALKGCYSQGKTVEELKANLTEAIQGYVEIARPVLAASIRIHLWSSWRNP
jgi:predicted RNase H-like HicB family nuclease